MKTLSQITFVSAVLAFFILCVGLLFAFLDMGIKPNQIMSDGTMLGLGSIMLSAIVAVPCIISSIILLSFYQKTKWNWASLVFSLIATAPLIIIWLYQSIVSSQG
jgi:hypothetical protein